MPKLKKTLVDACVVIGVNSDTELVHLAGGPQIGGDNNSKYEKYGPYKQHVLAVCTESVAFFPQATVRVEGEPFYEETQVICPGAVQVEEGLTPRPAAVRHSISYKPGTKRALPFSNEVITALPTFCFPNGGYIYKERQEPIVNFLVLTNMEGLRMYAVSITYSCPFMVAESVKEKGKYKIASTASPEETFGSESLSTLSQVYIPICVCLVSLYPFLDTMKECLSALLPQVEEVPMSEEFWRPIMKLTTVVTTIPVPPPGPLAIEFQLFGCSHVIYPADEAGRRIIDIDLQIPLLIFSPEVIVKIITCFLTQQRMVFMCSTYPMLTLIIEAFFTYIDPIKWRLTYVPVLPNSLGDLMEAPGPFIMGVHSDLRNQVKQIRRQPETPGIVLIDIDKGVIDIDDKTVVPKMPDIVAQSLLVRLRKASPPHQIQLSTMPSKFSYEESQQQRNILFEKTKAELKDIFLDMLVSLFGDIYNHMVVGERYFDKNSYLQSRHDDERSFFIEVLGTDAFERFVDERLENQERRDAFAVLGERIATQRKSPSRSRSSSIIQAIKMTTTMTPIFKSVTDRFSIPMSLEESLTSGNFYRVYCDSLTKQIEGLDSKAISLKASYLYLRGFARIACNYPIEGLRDFHSLYTFAPELTPSDYIYEVVSRMDPTTSDALEKEQFYKQTHMIRTFTNKESDRKRNPSRKLPNDPLTKADFEKRAKTYKIASSSELTEWLFSVLSEQGEHVVCPETFRTLYKVCLDIEKHSENREVSGVTIKTSDNILKVSPLISSMIGMGRLVLSTTKLFFVKDGGRAYSLVTQLIDIKELIKYQQQSVFFTGVQAIRIINSDRNIPPFYASLKDDRDLWFLFLSEMSAAHKSAEAMRDPKMVDAGKNNVLVASALLEMQYPLKTVEGACLFAKRRAVENAEEGLSEETKEALEMRLDPCVREAKRTTVMSIAYVPGNTAINESASVWCGMGSGAIMVYETNRWNCVSELRYAKNRISCLSLIGNNQIWAGSFDSVIYVINTETRKSEQQLQNHTDFVSDIISQEKSDSRTVAWSSSFNGQIVCWDPETREAINSFMLKKVRTLSQIMLVGHSNLWCVTSDKILLVDISQPGFSVIQKLIVYDEYEMPTLIEYALKVSEDEIWVGSKMQGGGLTIWDTKTCKSTEVKLDEKVKICSMISMADSIWVGNKDGKVFIMDRDRKIVERELHAHTDLVKSMCVTREGHVITGSSSKEGKVCVWNAMFGFDVIDAKKSAPGYEFIERVVTLPEPVEHY